ncbi:MAG: MaoC family dehydratase N-terminal domain-containing protein [Phreatobacter sp.]|uniref:FAS1-like dehydratase domain-containing protein n=1 Tax=Phreatobacter sp. TaxID=1966341 RepID=UPI001A373E82|nr:MaoC family dehydratase N-terminal domain-containing protein [Phreatobacter sp.]MBL8571405.1 MaoC family dehydratase N-terminal domain-containing protein [Phreatobacter sp.]
MTASEAMPTVGLGFRWEDTPVGFRFRTIGRTVTDADITAFVGVTGMVEVLFTNLDYLEKESLFAGKRLAPGALVYCFAEGLLMQSAVQGVGLSFLGMDLKVEAPTFAGDTIHVECEVVESRATSKPGRGMVKTANRIVNQRGETVMIYSPARLVKGRDYQRG